MTNRFKRGSRGSRGSRGIRGSRDSKLCPPWADLMSKDSMLSTQSTNIQIHHPTTQPIHHLSISLSHYKSNYLFLIIRSFTDNVQP